MKVQDYDTAVIDRGTGPLFGVRVPLSDGATHCVTFRTAREAAAKLRRLVKDGLLPAADVDYWRGLVGSVIRHHTEGRRLIDERASA